MPKKAMCENIWQANVQSMNNKKYVMIDTLQKIWKGMHSVYAQTWDF